jgi:uncharacterized membrane protein YgdD (TMEM256/DUF423 family)
MIKFSRFAVALLAFAGLSGALSVALGAYAAHGLAKVAPDGARAVVLFNEATGFQMNHTLALLLFVIVAEFVSAGCGKKVLRTAAVLMALAVVPFPSALYSSAFGGPVWWAPFGGTAAMIAWIAFAVGCIVGRGGSSAAQTGQAGV